MRGLRDLFPIAFLPVLFLNATKAYGDTVIPAGTLVECTVSEPDFSSGTAEIGDPLLCYASSIGVFGRSALPYGVYLAGRLEDDREPGHFVGKGWMELRFDRLVAWPDTVIPISAKVVGVRGLRVGKKGRIHGPGHATRDAVEWVFPPLWPWKVVTLPMRGPRPALRQETRMTVKLMEDVIVPGETSSRAALSSSRFKPDSALPHHLTVPTGARNEHAPVAPTTIRLAAFRQTPPSGASEKSTAGVSGRAILILKDGTVYVVKDYWLDGGTGLRFTTSDGAPGEISVDDLDRARTAAVNEQLGVRFAIRWDPPPSQLGAPATTWTAAGR
jgi:hypothetical protein